MKFTENPIERELLDIVYGYRKAQLLYIAAKLGISDILKEGPRTSDEIAELTKSNSDAIYRVLRALSGFEIYKALPDKRFELTKKGEYLCRSFQSSVWIQVIMRLEEYNWKPWGELMYSVKTGKSAFEKIFGMNLFEYLAKNPEASQVFSEAMGAGTELFTDAVMDTYDFSSFRVIVDLGGSNGDFLKKILSKYPSITGILLDVQSVISKIDMNAFDPGIGKRLKIIEASFFEYVPENCDLYVLKRILHDWDDEHCIKILKNCYNACQTGARVLIVETILEQQHKRTQEALINDIHMLVQTIGGRERSKEEYYNLLAVAGFEPLTVTPDYIEAIRQ